jgi:catechol 2,3-dioxygenase-like lactoylglutathione lyase family enzyme
MKQTTKRLHVHVSVRDLEQSTAFYTTLFGSAPNVLKPDYAKWMLDDPRVNFAISQRGRAFGVDHLGIQVDDGPELSEVAARLSRAGEPILEQKGAACCYARSDKAWVADPQGVSWETFHTLGEETVYGKDAAPVPDEPAATSACCAPRAQG